jgi:LysM repeat protein
MALGLLVLLVVAPWSGAVESPSEQDPAEIETEAPLAAAPLESDGGESASPFADIAVPPPTPTPGPLRPAVHVVESGDTILKLADRYGLRPESLLWANDLADPDLIVVGQKLVIPPTDGLIYVVETGDSLRGIVDRYALDMLQVATANAISDPDQIHVGSELVLPGARPVAPSRVVAAGPNTAPDAEAPRADRQALASLVIENPLPDNVPQLLAAAWLRTTVPNALHSGPEAGARRHTGLPAGVRLERTGDLAGRRIPVRDPGDGRTRQAMSGWVEVDGLEPAAAPSPRELPRAYPADTRMDIAHAFVPYRGQLDGSAYSAANCGPTTIGMVLESFGISIPQPRLRAEVLAAQGFGSNGTGTLITALAQVVEKHGLQTHDLRAGGQVRRWTLEDVRAHLRERHPVVVQVRYRALPGREGAFYYGDHYIVVTGILDDGFLYNDPIDYDGLGWDRVISGERLARAMDTSDRRYVQAAFAVSR